MGAQQSLETLDDMMRCDGCRGSNKDVPEHDLFNVNPPKHHTESKEDRLSRLVRQSFPVNISVDIISMQFNHLDSMDVLDMSFHRSKKGKNIKSSLKSEMSSYGRDQ